jgi:hypothetical protein
MTAEIAVGQAAQGFQIGKAQPIGMSGQRRGDPQAGFFMKDPIQSGVGIGRFAVRTRHGGAPYRDEE